MVQLKHQTRMNYNLLNGLLDTVNSINTSRFDPSSDIDLLDVELKAMSSTSITTTPPPPADIPGNLLIEKEKEEVSAAINENRPENKDNGEDDDETRRAVINLEGINNHIDKPPSTPGSRIIEFLEDYNKELENILPIVSRDHQEETFNYPDIFDNGTPQLYEVFNVFSNQILTTDIRESVINSHVLIANYNFQSLNNLTFQRFIIKNGQLKYVILPKSLDLDEKEFDLVHSNMLRLNINEFSIITLRSQNNNDVMIVASQYNYEITRDIYYNQSWVRFPQWMDNRTFKKYASPFCVINKNKLLYYGFPFVGRFVVNGIVNISKKNYILLFCYVAQNNLQLCGCIAYNEKIPMINKSLEFSKLLNEDYENYLDIKTRPNDFSFFSKPHSIVLKFSDIKNNKIYEPQLIEHYCLEIHTNKLANDVVQNFF